MTESEIEKLENEEETPWPEFTLPQEPEGVAMIDDFCETDRDKIRSIAKEQVEALFEDQHISIDQQQKQQQHNSNIDRNNNSINNSNNNNNNNNSNNSKNKSKKNSGSIRSENRSADRLPVEAEPEAATHQYIRSITQLLRQRGLFEVGIFRISASSNSVRQLMSKVTQVRADALKPALADADCHELAALLKNFIRQLRHQLLGENCSQLFLSLHLLQPLKLRILGLNLLILLLPSDYSSTLRTLVELFAEVVEQKERNQMSLNAISTVMAPNLLHLQQQEHLLLAKQLMQILIVYRHLLWRVPRFVLTMLRGQSLPSNALATKAWKQQQQLKQQPQSLPQAKMPIRCHDTADLHVLVGDDTTAADVLQYAAVMSDVSLWEIGGNIRVRRLRPEAKLRSVMAANPECQFSLR